MTLGRAYKIDYIVKLSLVKSTNNDIFLAEISLFKNEILHISSTCIS